MRSIDYPFHFDPQGRAADTTAADHIRDMIEQILMTGPGDRVNRPDFGAGLGRMIFEPTSPEVAAALQFTIRGSLQRWLGDVIDAQTVEVTSRESTLQVSIKYVVRLTGETRTDTFERSIT
ncbi:MAG TPA: GPW/gp25 family protein [Candidatus Acidoferrum sp.]|nr:GPW/gp25 family protein [Candidatus Acidoferrum sp.]